jgi:integrase
VRHVGSTAPPSIFTPTTKPDRPEKATSTFRATRDKVGSGETRLHDRGHFVATQMIGAGHDIRTVPSQLGHAQPSTKLNIYSVLRRIDTWRASAGG